MNAVIEYTTWSGVKLHITPLSISTLQAIVDKSQEAHPMFDESPFVKPLENSAVEGATYIDKDDREYKQLAMELANKRQSYITDAILRLCVSAENKAQLIEQSKQRLEELAAYITLSGDAWFDTLKHVVFSNKNDELEVYKIAQGRLPLSEEEVENGLRIFRPTV